MFKNKVFVFIGKFSRDDVKIIKKRDLVSKIKILGGKVVNTISKTTNYIIFPNIVLNKHLRNKQLKNTVNSNVQYLNFMWVYDSIKARKKLKFDKYKVSINNTKSVESKVICSMDTPFYENVIDKDTKCLIECIDPHTKKLFFVNTLNGVSSYVPSKDYSERLFGGVSIMDNFYNKKKIINSLKKERMRMVNTLNFLDMYIKGIK